MLPTIATWRPLTENTCSVPLLRNAAIKVSASGGDSPITTARMTLAACESSSRPAVTRSRKPWRIFAPNAAQRPVATVPSNESARKTAATPCCLSHAARSNSPGFRASGSGPKLPRAVTTAPATGASPWPSHQTFAPARPPSIKLAGATQNRPPPCASFNTRARTQPPVAADNSRSAARRDPSRQAKTPTAIHPQSSHATPRRQPAPKAPAAPNTPPANRPAAGCQFATATQAAATSAAANNG